MQYKRDISGKINVLKDQFPVLVLTGARQVGKTTLLKNLFPTYRYLSLDLPSLAEKADKEPELFLKEFPSPVIIDEVQYAPGLFRALKILVDQNRHHFGQYILTGSQKFSLMKEVSDSLAGRVCILELETLSLKEISQKQEWGYILERGFFPELWRNQKIDAYAYYSSYLATYIERDVRQILNITSLRDFERFIRSLAIRSGQLLNLTEVGKEVGIKAQTAKDWLSVLIASNQVTLLEPYFENLGKRLIKSPKIYFNDPGLLCFLLNLNLKTLMNSSFVGHLWETLIFAELRKKSQSSLRESQIYFYRDGQQEIDFLVISDSQIDLIEAKWTENPDQKYFFVLKKVESILKQKSIYPLKQKRIICRVPYAVTRDDVLIHSLPFV